MEIDDWEDGRVHRIPEILTARKTWTEHYGWYVHNDANLLRFRIVGRCITANTVIKCAAKAACVCVGPHRLRTP